MDPDLAYAICIDPDAAVNVRYEHTVALIGWIYGGGFLPAKWTGSRAELTDLLIVQRNRFRNKR